MQKPCLLAFVAILAVTGGSAPPIVTAQEEPTDPGNLALDLEERWFDQPQFHAALGRMVPAVEATAAQGESERGRWPAEIQPMDTRYFPFPVNDRYGRRERGFLAPFRVAQTGEYPILDAQPWWDPYNTSTLKGDKPIIGEHIFLRLDAVGTLVLENRDIAGRAKDEFVVVSQNFFSADLFHGDGVFRPPTWRTKVTVATDLRDADVAFAGKTQTDLALQEAFVEGLIAELDPYFDSISARLGRQPFQSDFRNFLFTDVNDGLLVFGNAARNRIQYDVGFFNLVEKDKFSNLNRTTERRNQQLFVVDAFLQDAVFEGYTVEASVIVLADDDTGSNRGDDANLVYLGFFGDGKIGFLEVSHSIVVMTGTHDDNPVASAARSQETGGADNSQDVDVLSGLIALEVAIPRDWYRIVGSVLFASGDTDAADDVGGGFDGIFDNPDFAGGNFSFWQRQAVNVGGAQIVNTNSLYPNLRTKAFNAPNSVNPGLFLLHGGIEADVSNFWSVFGNASMLSFVDTESLEAAAGGNASIDRFIGLDVSLAAQYRPFGIDNLVFLLGSSALVTGSGLRDTERAFGGSSSSVLLGTFVAATAVF